MKEIIGLIAVLLTFLAYVPYYRDILGGKTHPHVYSWSLWGLLTILIVVLQLKGGAGSAAYVTAAAGLMCIGIIFLSLKNGNHDITKSDKIVTFIGLLSIGAWLVADQPLASMFLLITADGFAFAPTVRKSWNKPHSETLSLYVTNTVRFSLAFLAVEEYTLLATLWIVFWVIGNGLFSIMLVVRRKVIDST